MKKNLILSLLVMTSLMFMVLGSVSAVNEIYDTIIAAADRLVETQNDDGGWIFANPTTSNDASSVNTFGVTAQGLLDAYELTGNVEYLTAAEEAGDWLISRFAVPGTVDISKRVNAFDIVFLYELGEFSTAKDYTGAASDLLKNVLNELSYFSTNGEYGSFCDNDGCTAQELFNGIDARRGGESGIILWDLAPWVKAANLGGQISWADDLKILMDEEYAILDFGSDYYIIGLTGTVSATENLNAVTDLLAEQLVSGSWASGNEEGEVQDTAYAVMALMSVGKMEAVTDGAEWLVIQQHSNGGWNDPENTEVTSEAVQALFDADARGPEITNPDVDPDYPNTKDLVTICADVEDESEIDSVSLTCSSSAHEFLEYNMVEGDPGRYCAGFLFTNAQDNEKMSCEITAIDEYDNSNTEIGIEFTYDGSAPTTTLTIGDPKYVGSTYINSSTEITLECVDTISDCDKTYYRIDDGSFNEVVSPYSFYLTGLSDGTYTISYYSVDNAGNSEDEKSQDVILDNTSPEVVLNELNVYYPDTPINLEFTYSDLGSEVSKYKVYKKRLGYDDDFVDVTSSVNCIEGITTICEFMDGDLDGEFEFKVEVIDNLGNSQDSDTVSTILDRTGPDAVVLDSPEDNFYLNSQPLLSWLEATDNDDNLNPAGGPYGISGIKEYELELDGELITLSELSHQTSELSEGPHIWRVRAWDNADNLGTWSKTRTFTIDITSPGISNINVNPKYENENIYVAGIITASATVIDLNGVNSVTFNLSVKECDATQVDGTWSCDIDTTTLEDGEYTLIVTAVDIAENKEIDDYSLVVIIDNTGPVTTIVSPEESSLFASDFEVNIKDSDEGSGLDECYYRVYSDLNNDGDFDDDGELTLDWTERNCNASINLTVGEGKNCQAQGDDSCKLWVKSIDEVGNDNWGPSYVNKVRKFSIDWTNPPQILDSGPSGIIVNDWAVLRVETNKPAICKYDIAYKTNFDAMDDYMETRGGTINSQLINGLQDKPYAYYVLCRDSIGNEMTQTVSIFFDVDTRGNFTVTIPETKGDYLSEGWNQFFLPSFVLEDTTLIRPYTVETVLQSINESYDMLYHFDGTEWTSYKPKRPVNDLPEFPEFTEFNGGGFPYFIHMNVAGERIELV